jgi:hypothetical protein
MSVTQVKSQLLETKYIVINAMLSIITISKTITTLLFMLFFYCKIVLHAQFGSLVG